MLIPFLISLLTLWISLYNFDMKAFILNFYPRFSLDKKNKLKLSTAHFNLVDNFMHTSWIYFQQVESTCGKLLFIVLE